MSVANYRGRSDRDFGDFGGGIGGGVWCDFGGGGGRGKGGMKRCWVDEIWRLGFRWRRAVVSADFKAKQLEGEKKKRCWKNDSNEPSPGFVDTKTSRYQTKKFSPNGAKASCILLSQKLFHLYSRKLRGEKAKKCSALLYWGIFIPSHPPKKYAPFYHPTHTYRSRFPIPSVHGQ